MFSGLRNFHPTFNWYGRDWMVTEYTFSSELAHSLQILFPGLCIHRLHISFSCVHFQLLDLSLTLISGTGEKLGRPVSFNLTAGGKIMGPLLHETQQGAYYILFGIGKGVNQQYEGLKPSSKED